jgi:hypothetical protein
MLKLFVMFITFLGFIYVLSGLEHTDIINSKKRLNSNLQGINHKLAAPVIKQIEAYNNKNIDEFIKFYSNDIELHRMQSSELICSGRDNLKTYYSDLFTSNKSPHIEVVKRITCGNFVIVEQVIYDLNNDDQKMATAIYEIKDDLIVKVWLVSNESL